MAKKSVSIDLEKIDPRQLPELENFKDLQLKAVEENPFVEIEDNKTYEVAKKHRTALVSSRTTLEKQERLITSKLNDFKKKVKDVTNELIEITKPHEDKQQEEVKRWEQIKEEERLEKLRIEQERVEGIKNEIAKLKSGWEEKISGSTVRELESIEFESAFDFQEFQSEFETMVGMLKEKVYDRIQLLQAQEEARVAEEKRLEEAKERERIDNIKNAINEFYATWLNSIATMAYDEIDEVTKAFAGADIKEKAEFANLFFEKKASLDKFLVQRIEQLKAWKQDEQKRIALENQEKERKLVERRNIRLAQVEELKKKEAKRQTAEFWRKLEDFATTHTDAQWDEVLIEAEEIITEVDVNEIEVVDPIVVVPESKTETVFRIFEEQLKPVIDQTEGVFTLKKLKSGYKLTYKE